MPHRGVNRLMPHSVFLRVFSSRLTSILKSNNVCNRPIQSNINHYRKILISAFKGDFNFHSFDFLGFRLTITLLLCITTRRTLILEV